MDQVDKGTQAHANGRRPVTAPEIELSENARTVLEKRYLRKGPDGTPAESIGEMFWRVAWHVAAPEDEHGEDRQAVAETFYDLLTRKRFFPNSPTFTGAGTPLGQLAACFVLAIADDMGREEEGIFQTLRNAALIQQTGGGNGFSFSRLRPKGARVSSSNGEATGPVGFLRVYDQAFGEIAQGGCLAPESLVFTDRGLLRLDEIVTHTQPDTWDEHDLSVATDEGWRRSAAGYNHGLARVLRVKTDAGLELTGTPNHRVKVMTGDGPAWRALEDLKPGDAILVKLGQHRGQFQALRIPQRQHGNQIMPSFPPLLDEELAFFLGYMAGDGFVASAEHDHRIGVSVAHDSYLMDEMPALMRRLFGGQAAVHCLQKDHDASVTYVIDNRAVKDFLVLNGLVKARSTEVRVPRLIRESPSGVVGAFLRGLFEADGSVLHHFPQLLSSSEALIREVATLLIGLGCPVRITSQMVGAERYGDQPMWNLRIRSFKGLEAWRELIGCDPRSRFAACLAFDPDLARESSYPLPHAGYWLTPVLDATRLPQIDRQGRGQGKKFRSTSPRLRRQLLRYQRGDRMLTLSGYSRLAEQHDEFAEHARSVDDIWFVTVETVEEAGESLTLDLEVDGNHTYLAYGMVTHNSRRGANMGVLRVDHPDIVEFVTAKTEEGQIENFNISVAVTDAFMQAVKDDASFDLINPQDGSVWETVRARDLFDLIVKHAHHNGEPGMLFIDAANRDNPVPHLYALEATNPCVVGGTRIATEFGLVTIEDLAQSGVAPFIAADNRASSGAPGVALRPASPAWKTRVDAPVLRLTTRQGYSVVATPDHRFLTPAGYVQLDALKPGDQLLLQSGEGAWSRDYTLPNVEAMRERLAEMALAGDRASGALVQRQDFQRQYANVPEQWSHNLGMVMGWLVGDGWLSEASGSALGIAFARDENLALVHQPLSEWFGSGHVHERGSVKQLTYCRVPYEFFSSLGLKAVRAHEKRVPDSIWTAPREAVVGFLQGLFSAGGTVLVNEAKRDCSVRLSSSSHGLLQDAQLLLSNFGIVSRLYRRRRAGHRPMPDGRGGTQDHDHRAQYELVIGKANRDLFAQEIGFLDDEKQAALMAFIDGKQRRTNREPFVDEVVSIEDAGCADVYDLSQPQSNSLIANGIVAHNCGEQWLGPFENCCLGSVNLGQHVTPDGQVDWDKLRETVELSTRFLDDVVDANKYVPAVPQLEVAAHRVRRIGLGIMGLGDLMYALGVRYGSDEGQEFAAQVMEFVHYHSMRTSVELSRRRGPFLAIRGSRFDPDDLKWEPPTPLKPYERDWGRPALDWQAVVEGIKQHGIRNGAHTTIAPTGTISTVAGVEGYGCEPVFALAYVRYFDDKGTRRQLQYTSPQFEQALVNAGLDAETRQRIVEQVNRTGSCQDVPGVPEEIKRVFVVASDISAEEHVYMQAAMQRFVSNSISKTCNFPATATEQDVADAFLQAWELGCKGLTVYVAGSREKVVLETAETAQQREGEEAAVASARAEAPVVQASEPEELPLFGMEKKKPRSRVLPGWTYRLETPLGTTFVTVNENGHSEPFEVFMHTSKAGSETAAVSEAMGRLISYILRLRSPVPPHERLKEVIRQLEGIGGGRSLGLGPNRVRSLPDGIAQVLAEYLVDREKRDEQGELHAREHEQVEGPAAASVAPGQMVFKFGDLCPDCGEAAVVNEEGCRKCYACGYSEC